MKATLRIVSIVSTALAAATASAQVSPLQTGRNLDVNLRLGSGGYNSVVRSTRIDSQLYVSGQVTGLGGFHGNVNYVASNELRTWLPSEALDGFRTRSVGLGQIAQGGTFRTEAYYRRTATAMGLSDIMRGRAAVGSSMPVTSRGEPALVRRLYREATAGYVGLMDSPIRRELSTTPTAWQHYDGVTSRIPLIGGRGDRPAAPGTGASSLGVLKQPDGEELAKDLYELHRVDADVDLEVDLAVDARLDAATRNRFSGLDDESLPPLPGDLREFEQTRGGKVTKGMPASDEDVFLDLLMRLREQRTGQEATKRPEGRRTREPIVQLSDKNDIVLRGFAGRGNDLFNLHMKRAKRHLEDGQFYKAVGAYDIAAIASPGNPLTRMGLCVAYFCAGEALTASLQLRRAFAMFPALMGTRIDIRGMMGTTVLRHRLAELGRRAEQEGVGNERMLALMLAFIHRNAGNTDQAKHYALMLKRIAKSDKILTGYATFILTGEMPRAKAPAGKAQPKPTAGGK